jgi:hypothetical protein
MAPRPGLRRTPPNEGGGRRPASRRASPSHVFQVATGRGAARLTEVVSPACGQQWARNIRTSEAARRTRSVRGRPRGPGHLPPALRRHRRTRRVPRRGPGRTSQRMWESLNADTLAVAGRRGGGPGRSPAPTVTRAAARAEGNAGTPGECGCTSPRHQGERARGLDRSVRVGPDHVWYSYGASADQRPAPESRSNALQWRMLSDAHGGRCRRLRPARHRCLAGRRRAAFFGPPPASKLGSGGGAPSSTSASGSCHQPAAAPRRRRLPGATGRGRRCRSPCTIDTYRWRTPQAAACSRGYPGIVPVIKGNGYGVGLARLALEGRAAGGRQPSPSARSTR